MSSIGRCTVSYDDDDDDDDNDVCGNSSLCCSLVVNLYKFNAYMYTNGHKTP